MISYLETLQHSTKLGADICIVGTGPAGITIARELIGSGLKVIMLESGDFDFDPDVQNLYAGNIIENLPPVPLDVSRLRYFGGTSNHWDGSCGPLDAMDFKARDWIPNSGWPFTLEKLEPHYRAAHQIIGLGPYEYRSSAWNSEHWDLLDCSHTGITHGMRQSHPQRFGSFYQKDLEDADNIHIILHANLTALETDSAIEHVTEIEASTLDGQSIAIEAKNVVLACGGVENARLLLAFGMDAKLPAVGRYFNWHPHLLTGQLILEKPQLRSRFPYRWQSVDGTRVMHHLLLTEQSQKDLKLPNHAAKIKEIRQPDTQGYSAAKRIFERLKGHRNMDDITEDLYDVLTDLDGAYTQWNNRHAEHEISILEVETYMDQAPHPDSRITLSQEVDALGMPQSEINWAYFDHEIEGVQQFNEVLATSFGAAGIGRMQIMDNLTDPDTFESLVRDRSTGQHQIGSTRISENAATGVVDANCKVHGMDNLFCAGSSVFPTASHMNPTTTIVALAVRLGEHLRANCS